MFSIGSFRFNFPLLVHCPLPLYNLNDFGIHNPPVIGRGHRNGKTTVPGIKNNSLVLEQGRVGDDAQTKQAAERRHAARLDTAGQVSYFCLARKAQVACAEKLLDLELVELPVGGKYEHDKE